VTPTGAAGVAVLVKIISPTQVNEARSLERSRRLLPAGRDFNPATIGLTPAQLLQLRFAADFGGQLFEARASDGVPRQRVDTTGRPSTTTHGRLAATISSSAMNSAGLPFRSFRTRTSRKLSFDDLTAFVEVAIGRQSAAGYTNGTNIRTATGSTSRIASADAAIDGELGCAGLLRRSRREEHLFYQLQQANANVVQSAHPAVAPLQSDYKTSLLAWLRYDVTAGHNGVRADTEFSTMRSPGMFLDTFRTMHVLSRTGVYRRRHSAITFFSATPGLLLRDRRCTSTDPR